MDSRTMRLLGSYNMDINNAMQEVNERSKENYESISKVSSELGKFKVNHQE